MVENGFRGDLVKYLRDTYPLLYVCNNYNLTEKDIRDLN